MVFRTGSTVYIFLTNSKCTVLIRPYLFTDGFESISRHSSEQLQLICNFYSVLEKPHMGHKVLFVTSVTSSSAEVLFEQLTMDEMMAPYYFYVLQYKKTGSSFTDATSMPHSKNRSLISATIPGLDTGTEYVVQVVPFRRGTANGSTDAGWPTETTVLTTGM